MIQNPKSHSFKMCSPFFTTVYPHPHRSIFNRGKIGDPIFHHTSYPPTTKAPAVPDASGACRTPPWPNSSTSTATPRSSSRGSAPPPTSRSPRHGVQHGGPEAVYTGILRLLTTTQIWILENWGINRDLGLLTSGINYAVFHYSLLNMMHKYIKYIYIHINIYIYIYCKYVHGKRQRDLKRQTLDNGENEWYASMGFSR